METNCVLGIDIGGTGIKAALINTETGELLTERKRVLTPKPSTPEAILNSVKEMVDDFNYQGLIGIGFPSIIKDGYTLTASNVDKGWINYPAKKAFEEKLKMPVAFMNDADAAGLAEMTYGKGLGKKGSVIMITIGTGLGSALFYNGVLVPNTELGHILLHNMIAEKYTSNIVRKSEDLSWKKWGGRFNEYLQHLCRLFSPNTIILGGGVSKKFYKFSQYLDVDTEVLEAELQNRAGVVGAAVCAAHTHPSSTTILVLNT